MDYRKSVAGSWRVKSTDSAVILYESKFQEMNAQIEEQKQTLNANAEKNNLLEIKCKQQNRKEAEKYILIDQPAEQLSQSKKEKEQLMNELKETREMAAQTTDYRVMQKHIDKKK